jgi:hypothetical protein
LGVLLGTILKILVLRRPAEARGGLADSWNAENMLWIEFEKAGRSARRTCRLMECREHALDRV